MPHSIFAGIVGEKKYVQPVLNQAFDLSRKLNCDFLFVKQPPISYYNTTLNEYSMIKTQDMLDQYVILDSPEILWNKLHRSCLKSIIKANRNKVKIRTIDNKKEIDKVYNLKLILDKRLGLGPLSKKYFINLWEKLYSKNLLEIFLAEKDGVALSFDIFLKFKNRMLGIANAPSEQGRKLLANHLLIWEAMKWGYNNGYQILDLGSTPGYFKNGSVNQSDGLFKFKFYFGCCSTKYSYFYYPNEMDLNNIDKDNMLLYKLGKKFFKKTPICISKKAGPIANRLFYE